jgi:hypothetical protein
MVVINCKGIVYCYWMFDVGSLYYLVAFVVDLFVTEMGISGIFPESSPELKRNYKTTSGVPVLHVNKECFA